MLRQKESPGGGTRAERVVKLMIDHRLPTISEIVNSLTCPNSGAGCDCGREIKQGTWRVHCPAHEDRTPSLDVTLAPGGKVLVKCHAGCSQEAVIAALRERGLWPKTSERSGPGPTGSGGLSLAEFAKAKRLDISLLRQNHVTEATGRDGKPYVVFGYLDPDGKPIPEAVRFRFGMGEKPKAKRGGKPTLYGLWRLPDFRPGGWLLLCEGESDCLTAWAYGLPAVGIPGKTLIKALDPELFAGYSALYVWQEPDAPDLPGKVAARLRDVDGMQVYAMVPPDGVKDISEAHCQGLDVVALVDRLRAAAVPAATAAKPGRPAKEKKEKGEKPSQAELLIKLALGVELFHDAHRTGHASIKVDGHTETMPIRSRDFRLWLRRRFFEAYQKSPGGQALQDALETLEARAMFDGQTVTTFTRIAEHNGDIYLDLCDDEWRAVKIDTKGWEVVSDPPVKFVRRPGMLPLPLPQRGGRVNDLRPFLNLPPGEPGEMAWRLVVAWLVAALRPTGPYPILALHGPQGCAKSTAARLLRSLVDPNSAPLRGEFREVRDLVIAARNGWVVCMDNLTRIKQWLSDSLCRLATGGGQSFRTLYSDEDETLFDAVRPVILTGINPVAHSQDLADRQLLIDLAMINDQSRRKESDLWAEFESARPFILGAILDGVATALRRIPDLKLDRLPRMADFAAWATAAEAAWGWQDGALMEAYDQNRAGIVRASIEADIVSAAILEFMADRETWEGTPTELLESLRKIVKEEVLSMRNARGYLFPQTANSLTRRLRKAAVFLEKSGVIFWHGENKKGSLIRIEREKTATTATTATFEENQEVTGGDIASEGGDIATAACETATP